MTFQHKFDPTSLREYDIRGIVGKTLSGDDAFAIGRCFGTIVKREGGSVVAVDLPRPALWGRLLERAGRSAGTLTLPVRPGGGSLPERAGADLLHDLPAVAAWLGDVEGRLLLGKSTTPGGTVSLSGSTLTPEQLAGRTGLALAYVVISMLGVAAIALFFSTLTKSSVAAALAAADSLPERLMVAARCAEGPVDDGFAVMGMELTVDVDAPRLDRADLESLVDRTAAGCPMLRAIRGNVPVEIVVAG